MAKVNPNQPQPHGNLADIKVQAQAALAVVNKMLAFGPRVPEFTGHIAAGLTEFEAAVKMVSDQFGLGAVGDIRCDPPDWDVLVQHCPELETKCNELQQKCGNASGVGSIKDFLTSLLSNPILLGFLLSLFKVPLPMPPMPTPQK